MNVKEIILQDPRVAGAVSGVTITSGAGTYLDYIPDDIGKLATLVGIILTLILAHSHWLIIKKNKLELKIMERKELERQEEVARRIAEGLPTRRDSDGD